VQGRNACKIACFSALETGNGEGRLEMSRPSPFLLLLLRVSQIWGDPSGM
jgi:hypothetical protein